MRVRELLKDARLREKLVAIDNSKQRMTSVQEAMNE